jgi:hypothetical protein
MSPSASAQLRASLDAKQQCSKLLSCHLEVLRNVGQDGRQCSDAEGAVLRDRDMVLAMFDGRESKVTARLSSDLISKSP